MSLIFTQADLDALKEAWVTGATGVKIGDRWVQFDSREQLEARMREIMNYLEGNSSASDDNPTMIQAGYSRNEK